MAPELRSSEVLAVLLEKPMLAIGLTKLTETEYEMLMHKVRKFLIEYTAEVCIQSQQPVKVNEPEPTIYDLWRKRYGKEFI